jgi:hypothetical protein
MDMVPQQQVPDMGDQEDLVRDSEPQLVLVGEWESKED